MNLSVTLFFKASGTTRDRWSADFSENISLCWVHFYWTHSWFFPPPRPPSLPCVHSAAPPAAILRWTTWEAPSGLRLQAEWGFSKTSPIAMEISRICCLSNNQRFFSFPLFFFFLVLFLMDMLNFTFSLTVEKKRKCTRPDAFVFWADVWRLIHTQDFPENQSKCRQEKALIPYVSSNESIVFCLKRIAWRYLTGTLSSRIRRVEYSVKHQPFVASGIWVEYCLGIAIWGFLESFPKSSLPSFLSWYL